jgi:hypothetical protein
MHLRFIVWLSLDKRKDKKCIAETELKKPLAASERVAVNPIWLDLMDETTQVNLSRVNFRLTTEDR